MLIDIVTHSELSNLEWSVAGHVMDATLDMNSNAITEVTTLTAEQLTSTDDITMQGHLFTLGNTGSANNIVMSFLSSGNIATITYDQTDDEFDLGDAFLTSTGGCRFDGNFGAGIAASSGSGYTTGGTATATYTSFSHGVTADPTQFVNGSQFKGAAFDNAISKPGPPVGGNDVAQFYGTQST